MCVCMEFGQSIKCCGEQCTTRTLAFPLLRLPAQLDLRHEQPQQAMAPEGPNSSSSPQPAASAPLAHAPAEAPPANAQFASAIHSHDTSSPPVDSHVNAEEAQRALQLGKKALEAGLHKKAISLLEKSLRMRKTAEAEALLGMATRATARAQAKDDPGEAVPQRAFTPEQLKGVQAVSKAKTHYQVLMIEVSADDAAIKKAYRRMALQFHPDKNSAPGADEAFKRISKAFEVLNDPQSRAHYDRYGEADPSRPLGNGPFHQGGGGGGHHHVHQDMDPDELFRMFFGGGGPFGGGAQFHQFGAGGFNQARRRQQQPQGGIRPQEISPGHLLWLLATMVMFISMFWGGGSASAGARPPFAFEQAGSLAVSRHTMGLNGLVKGIPYFVDGAFHTWARVPENLFRFEAHVQDSFGAHLQRLCKKEKDDKARLMAYAKGDEAREAASAKLTPNCDNLRSFQQVLSQRSR
jgi:curved DNA-binding protein CbpA